VDFSNGTHHPSSYSGYLIAGERPTYTHLRRYQVGHRAGPGVLTGGKCRPEVVTMNPVANHITQLSGLVMFYLTTFPVSHTTTASNGRRLMNWKGYGRKWS
jgi:hypothetical protein